ncbi:Protein like [Actinidia chinensis var. chinensis]|uniref:protein-serine/threonine phosphatase n=1 Tax=Actinidia chinensis var. chinensis TaxID=1590841 RepID=A0A2R6PTB8_ACTCC|nr:Protein like [Actinidia chinensis var. chinensis]
MGTYLSTPKTEKESEDGENERLKYGLSSMQGWRSSMEDAHAAHLDFDSSTSFFGVYDGHGGKEVAKFCAKYLHQQVLENEAYLAGDIGTSLQQAFLRMDTMMSRHCGKRELAILGEKIQAVESTQRELAKIADEIEKDPQGQSLRSTFVILGDEIEKTRRMMEDLISSPEHGEDNGVVDDCTLNNGPRCNLPGTRPTSGSTACVAIIRNNQLLVANAGDSRCVISRKGQAYNLTRDHKPYLKAEKHRILEAGGFVQGGRANGNLNVARAIGDLELKQNKSLPAEKQVVTANPELNTVELCNDDEFLVIACDGIWDSMSVQEVVDFVRKQLNTETKLSVVCERVFDNCIAPCVEGRSGCDNMTMILVQFKKPFDCTLEQPPLISYPDPPPYDPYSDSDWENRRRALVAARARDLD